MASFARSAAATHRRRRKCLRSLRDIEDQSSDRHTPRKRGIQYAAASRSDLCGLRILDHPPSRVMTKESASPSHLRLLAAPIASESLQECFAPKRGRGECRARDAPAASRAKKKAHE